MVGGQCRRIETSQLSDISVGLTSGTKAVEDTAKIEGGVLQQTYLNQNRFVAVYLNLYDLRIGNRTQPG